MRRSIFLVAALISVPALAQTQSTPGLQNEASPGQTSSTSNAANTNELHNLVATVLPALIALQEQIQQTLAGIAVFNVSIATARSHGAIFPDELPTPTQTPQTIVSGKNFGRNFGANHSTRTSVAAGQNLSVSPGAIAPPPSVPPSPLQNAAPGILPVTSEAARRMIVLQNDLERLIPVLATLNPRPGAETAPENSGELLAPEPVVVPTHPPLSPTGR